MHEQKELSPAIRYLIDNDIKSINCMILIVHQKVVSCMIYIDSKEM